MPYGIDRGTIPAVVVPATEGGNPGVFMINETRRIYGQVKEIALPELRQVFSGIPEIRIALLFGSRAEGGNATNSKSDYDFAVLLDKSLPSDWGHLAQARIVIGEKLQLPDTDFDVVDLQTAGPELLISIKSNFLILKGDQNDVLRLFGEYFSNR